MELGVGAAEIELLPNFRKGGAKADVNQRVSRVAFVFVSTALERTSCAGHCSCSEPMCFSESSHMSLESQAQKLAALLH